MPKPLRDFSETHIDEDCSTITGLKDNALFFNCAFNKLNGLTLKDCDLNKSEFKTESVADALGFAMSLSCLSFRGVKYSETLFDLLLTLITMTVGNDEKRKKLIDVVGERRWQAIMRMLTDIE